MTIRVWHCRPSKGSKYQDREDLVCARNSKEANVLSKGRTLHSEFKDVASIQIMLSLVGQNLNNINLILLLM